MDYGASLYGGYRHHRHLAAGLLDRGRRKVDGQRNRSIALHRTRVVMGVLLSDPIRWTRDSLDQGLCEQEDCFRLNTRNAV
jgi:hypothetical protein